MTFSIVAIDCETGECGSAVVSRSVAVGGTVAFSRAAVGAINTQHHAHLTMGNRILKRMENGLAPHEALEAILADDAAAEERQFIAIDVRGRRGAWTGGCCAPACRHQFGANCVAAGNYLVSEAVVGEMVGAFEETAGGRLESRLMAAISAGERAGGDSRGQRAAAMIVVPGADVEVDINLDLRIDDHKQPLAELRRLHAAFRREFPYGRVVGPPAGHGSDIEGGARVAGAYHR